MRFSKAARCRRHVGRGVALGVAALTVSASLTAGGASHAGAAVSAPPDSVEASLQLARDTGRPVLLDASVTPVAETFVNPDGSYTLEQSAVPERVQRGDSWVPVDPTLVRQPDGEFAPRAVTVPMRFSAGGSGPFASITRDGVTVSLGWPKPLPAPSVAGDTATYADVLPGVDLAVRATADSFSEVLVVKTATAAVAPALKSVRFTTAVTGGRIASDGMGGAVVTDQSGRAVLVSPEPQMWDSRGSRQPAATGGATDATTPPDGARVAALPESVSAGALSLTPAASLLGDPQTTYPVYIDPSMSPSPASRAMVNKAFPTTSYYNWSGSDEGDGYNDFTSPTVVKRLYWRFSLSGLAGTHVSSATFYDYEDFSAECVRSQIDLYMGGPISSSTTWNNQPSSLTYVSDVSPPGVRPSSGADCTTSQQYVSWSAKAAVTGALGNGWTGVTLGLRAHNETTDAGWHRFVPGAKLSITYDHSPDAPSSLKTTSGDTGCSSSGQYLGAGDNQPTLHAKGTDEDGGNLTMHFEIDHNGARWGGGTSATAKSGSDFTFRPVVGLPNGTYTWFAWANDGSYDGPDSATCTVIVDTSKPPAPSVTSFDNVYQSGSVGGGIGQSGTFSLSPGSATDVTRYAYGFNDIGLPKSVTSSGSVTKLTLTPSSYGPQTLYVESIDAAGNPSALTTYSFSVAGTGAISGRWLFDEGSGSTSADSSGNPTTHPVTLGAGVVWTAGVHNNAQTCPNDHAVAFPGTTSTATGTSGSVVDTTGSFSVSAWVWVDPDTTQDSTVVAEGGTNRDAFALRYLAALQAFQISVVDADVNGVLTPARTVSGSIPTGEWFHVLGVYNASSQDLDLYVYFADGASLKGHADPTAPPFHATSGMRVGSSTDLTKPFTGQVDDVRVFPGPLAESDNVTLATDNVTSCPFAG